MDLLWAGAFEQYDSLGKQLLEGWQPPGLWRHSGKLSLLREISKQSLLVQFHDQAAMVIHYNNICSSALTVSDEMDSKTIWQ
ncbi:hypothetical protein RHGRI_022128 [Rhododendron griersonianum]|uniref:Uncharacterized protein n=1 Tax=Rhododendron griersonianum TaxID=479676 RepID=A0AAV6JMQ3_9ERIC|nr:hypothetical protein RHGRI_022128 [Rhododendron griersonianum]